MSGAGRLGVVTGGARGIGLAIVRRLLADGIVDEVVVLECDPVELTEATVVACDVTDEAAIAQAVATLGERPLQALVNNVGGGRFEPDADPFPPVSYFRQMLELNLLSAFAVTRALQGSLPRGAAVCNVLSGAALGTNPVVLQPYAAAKAGLLHWTTDIAVALAPRGVRVNGVAPGFVWTDLVEHLVRGDRASFDAMASDRTATGTEQTGDDIAHAVSFLCDPVRAAQVTGHVIPVDGGASVSRQSG